MFTPVALCGIGRLPAATEDRCLRIVLVRKPVGRTTTRLDKTKKKHLRDLAPEILRWTQDSRKVLMQNLEPDFPAGVENDRDEDLWRPLLAIADTSGGEVPVLARRAMRSSSPSAISRASRRTHDGGLHPRWRKRSSSIPRSIRSLCRAWSAW